MEALIDWLSFTVKEYEGKTATAKSVIEDILNFDMNVFKVMNGGYGYKKQFYYNNIKIYFDGKENMGVHVLMSGEGVRCLEASNGFNWNDFLYLLLNWFNARITRMDAAIDDKEGVLDLQLLEEKMRKAEVVSKWKYGHPMGRIKLATGGIEGHTLYFGEFKSDIFCRFYDKREKEKEKYKKQGKELPEHWIRCELEMHKEIAHNFATQYAGLGNRKPLGQLFIEILNNYMRVTDKADGINRYEWENCEMWDAFIHTTEKLALTTKPMEKKVEDLYTWVKQSVSPSLFVLFKAAYGDMDFFHELVKEGSHRLSKKHIQMLVEYENRPMGVPYSIESVRHDLEERKYAVKWELAEREQQYQKLINVLKAIQLKKSIQYVQCSIFDESQKT